MVYANERTKASTFMTSPNTTNSSFLNHNLAAIYSTTNQLNHIPYKLSVFLEEVSEYNIIYNPLEKPNNLNRQNYRFISRLYDIPLSTVPTISVTHILFNRVFNEREDDL